MVFNMEVWKKLRFIFKLFNLRVFFKLNYIQLNFKLKFLIYFFFGYVVDKIINDISIKLYDTLN